MNVTVSTCGTSILTNGTDKDDIKFIRDNANKNESDYIPEDLARMNRIIADKREKLINANIQEVQRLSAELNGFISFYDDGALLDEARQGQNMHYLIHTDTYQGVKAAELIREWGELHKITMHSVLIQDLNTASVEKFMLGINNLVNWCAVTLPGYHKSGYRIIFNLVGGFKSLQGYMQTLGMFYADETVYIFESGGELLRIPKMPVDFSSSAKQAVIENSRAFRRMQRGDVPLSECKEIPTTLLDIIDDKCTMSAWGKIIWDETQRGMYSDAILPPMSERIIITRKAQKSIPPDKIDEFNKAIDRLSRYLETNGAENPHTCDFRALTANPVPPSTHEFNLWSDMGAWRGFCHFDESNNLIVDSAGMGLHHV